MKLYDVKLLTITCEILAQKNVKVEVIMREEKLSAVIEDISRTLFPDFTIILYVSDVGVVRTEKF